MSTTTQVTKREQETVRGEPVRAGRTYIPPVDIIETDDKLILLADLPGVKAEDLDITYERGELTIHGKVQPRQEPGTQFLLREYGIGDFYRSFQIGEGLDPARFEAQLKDGVLTLTMPKTAELTPRKIAVKTG